jgi:hypothetical protein
LPGKTEQKKIEHTGRIEAGNNIQVEAVKRFLDTLEGQFAKKNSLAGFRNG